MKRHALVLSLFALVSCGVSPGDPSAPLPGDGVGALGEASPIEVCLGTARIVAPALATGAAALCVPEGQKARVCASDGECQGIERCVCGRCIVEPCQGAGSCEGDLVCRGRRCTRACAADLDCAAGERCISGGCAKPCGGDGDCHHGERCDALDDVCVVSLCGGGGSCGAKTQCESAAFIAAIGEPAFLGDEPRAFFELTDGAARSIYRAHLDAPERWRVDPEAPVFTLAGESWIGAPSVIRRGASLELYAEVGAPSRIVKAISQDEGASFTSALDPVLAAVEPWEDGSVGSPSVVEFQGKTYLFYEGGAAAGIGLARLGDAGAERVGKEPVLRAATVEDPIFWRSISSVGAPHALVQEGMLKLFFTARGIEGFSAAGPEGPLPADINHSIGFAATSDLKKFALYPAGPIYARRVNVNTYLGEREAFFRPLAAGAEMVFVSADASGEGVTGLYRAISRGSAE